MKHKPKNILPLVGIVTLITICIGAIIYLRNTQTTYIDPVHRYSFIINSNMKIDSETNDSIRVWENKDIDAAPPNSDMEGSTKYIAISSSKFDTTSLLEKTAMKDLYTDMLRSKSEFELNGIKFSEYCFETSANFCDIYTVKDDTIYKFRLHENDSWQDSPFYKSFFSSFKFI